MCNVRDMAIGVAGAAAPEGQQQGQEVIRADAAVGVQ